MADSIHLKLPYILPGQAQKHITHNEAIAALDTLVQLAVLDRDLAAPPASPVAGGRYIVGAAATDEWAGRTGQIAIWDGVAWLFHAPQPGWLAFVLDENGLLAWSGSAWLPTLGLDGEASMLGLNATPDTTNRLAVASDAVLFSHASAGVQLKLNKNVAGDTAALLFQTGFSGRAEFGTAGDDKLHLKVSADGVTWVEALVVDTEGSVAVGAPIALFNCTVADLPVASPAGLLVYVSDASGGPQVGYSDGAAWRRVADGVEVS